MQLQIKVFAGITSMASDQRLFERVVEVHDDLKVPYESLFSDLKFLYGSSCLIQFTVL